MKGKDCVIVDTESSVSVFRLRGIPPHLNPQKDSSRTSAGWEVSLTPIKAVSKP
jgi:hypothetical protein